MKISRFDIVIHKNGNKKAIEEFCEKYDITDEEIPDLIAEISNHLEDAFSKIAVALLPKIEYLNLQMSKFEEAMSKTREGLLEFWNSIPDEVKEAIAEYEADNPKKGERGEMGYMDYMQKYTEEFGCSGPININLDDTGEKKV